MPPIVIGIIVVVVLLVAIIVTAFVSKTVAINNYKQLEAEMSVASIVMLFNEVQPENISL